MGLLLIYLSASFWTLVSQSSPLPRWLTSLSPETANAQTKMTSSCHPNGNSQIGRSSSDWDNIAFQWNLNRMIMPGLDHVIPQYFKRQPRLASEIHGYTRLTCISLHSFARKIVYCCQNKCRLTNLPFGEPWDSRSLVFMCDRVRGWR